MKISPQLSEIVKAAVAKAKSAHHEFVTPEHVLSAALDNMSVQNLFVICGADVAGIRENVNEYLQKHIPLLSGKKEIEPIETVGFHSVFERIVTSCLSSERDVADVQDLIVSLLDETKNYCSYYMRLGGIERLHLLEVISYMKSADMSELSGDDAFLGGEAEDGTPFDKDVSFSHTRPDSSSRPAQGRTITSKTGISRRRRN